MIAYSIKKVTIEHSGNKTIVQSGLFENEIGHGVLQSSVQKTRTPKAQSKGHLLYFILSYLSGILAGECSLNARLEHPRSNLIILFWECSIVIELPVI